MSEETAPAPQSPAYGAGHDALIRATVRVVARRGLRGMTFRAVAEEAGVRNSLITYHFGNRETLLVETVKWVVAESLSRTLPTDAETIDAGFVHALLAMVRADPDIQVFHYEVLLEARRNPALHDLAELLVEGYLAGLERILIERGHPRPQALARLLHATFDGLVLQEVTTPSLRGTDAALDLIAELVAADHPALH